ncbi:MAG: helix-turn-helix transcriptional regulator [Calditrichaeota bacterium]|nr:helix-turn-helix transcriptional regulator [Calditrichota bacterium]
MRKEKSIFRPDYRLIVDWLSSKRQVLGITQEQLAQNLSKPQSYVSKYENCERRLDVVEFLEICKVLGINPQDILEKVL